MSEQKNNMRKEQAILQLERIGRRWPDRQEGNESLITALLFEAWPYVRVIGEITGKDYSYDDISWILGTTGKKGSIPRDVVTSSNDPISSEDEGTTIEDTIASSEILPDVVAAYSDAVASMVAVVLNYQEMVKRGGRLTDKDMKHILQNRICFTEQISSTLMEGASTCYLRQKDIMNALHRDYLSYFSENGDTVQALEDFQQLRLKPESNWLGTSVNNVPLGFTEDNWLPGAVPRGYLTSIAIKTSPSQVTEMRDRYMREVRQILMEQLR